MAPTKKILLKRKFQAMANLRLGRRRLAEVRDEDLRDPLNLPPVVNPDPAPTRAEDDGRPDLMEYGDGSPAAEEYPAELPDLGDMEADVGPPEGGAEGVDLAFMSPATFDMFDDTFDIDLYF